MPSLKPSRFRGTPVGRGTLTKPSMRHRGCMAPRVYLVMSRRAWMTVSASVGEERHAQVAMALARSRLSSGNDTIGFSTGRLDRCESVPRVEQRRSDADRGRQLVAGHHRPEDPVVRRRCRRPGVGRHPPGRQYPGPVGDGAEEPHHAGPVGAMTSNETKRAAREGRR